MPNLAHGRDGRGAKGWMPSPWFGRVAPGAGPGGAKRKLSAAQATELVKMYEQQAAHLRGNWGAVQNLPEVGARLRRAQPSK